MENKSSYILPIGGLILGAMVLSRFGLLPSGKSAMQQKKANELTFNMDLSPGYITRLKQAELKAKGVLRGKFLEEKFSISNLEKLAQAMYRTRGGIRPDDEAGLYSILRRVKYRTALAQLDSYFFTKYKKDLPNFWASYLNDAELANVYNIVSKMQTGLKFVS